MNYDGMIFRPPSEADSILLQVTVGCSHNKCSFCEMYKAKRFQIKKDDAILNDIDYAAKHFRYMERLFICDGDALIVPQVRLIKYLRIIKEKLPWIRRVGTYANTKSIGMKSIEELKELKSHGLGIVYMGLETGDDITLKAINKGATAYRMTEMGKKIKASGIKLSITVLLGIGGKERSLVHAEETGKILSQIDPDFVGALTLMLTPGTSLYKDHIEGKFPILEAHEMLKELGVMVANTSLSNGLFHANHASNYLPIRAKFPEDKDKTLRMIEDALKGKISLKPEHLRGL